MSDGPGRDDPSETRVELFKLREFHMEGAHVYSEKGVAVGPHGALYVVSSPEEIRLTDKAHRSVEQICVDFSPCLASLKSEGEITYDVYPALDAIAVSPKGSVYCTVALHRSPLPQSSKIAPPADVMNTCDYIVVRVPMVDGVASWIAKPKGVPSGKPKGAQTGKPKGASNERPKDAQIEKPKGSSTPKVALTENDKMPRGASSIKKETPIGHSGRPPVAAPPSEKKRPKVTPPSEKERPKATSPIPTDLRTSPTYTGVFRGLTDLAVSRTGSLYTGNTDVIYRLSTKSGEISTFLSSIPRGVGVDSSSSRSRSNGNREPKFGCGISCDRAGNVYLANYSVCYSVSPRGELIHWWSTRSMCGDRSVRRRMPSSAACDRGDSKGEGESGEESERSVVSQQFLSRACPVATSRVSSDRTFFVGNELFANFSSDTPEAQSQPNSTPTPTNLSPEAHPLKAQHQHSKHSSASSQTPTKGTGKRLSRSCMWQLTLKGDRSFFVGNEFFANFSSDTPEAQSRPNTTSTPTNLSPESHPLKAQHQHTKHSSSSSRTPTKGTGKHTPTKGTGAAKHTPTKGTGTAKYTPGKGTGRKCESSNSAFAADKTPARVPDGALLCMNTTALAVDNHSPAQLYGRDERGRLFRRALVPPEVGHKHLKELDHQVESYRELLPWQEGCNVTTTLDQHEQYMWFRIRSMQYNIATALHARSQGTSSSSMPSRKRKSDTLTDGATSGSSGTSGSQASKKAKRVQLEGAEKPEEPTATAGSSTIPASPPAVGAGCEKLGSASCERSDLPIEAGTRRKLKVEGGQEVNSTESTTSDSPDSSPRKDLSKDKEQFSAEVNHAVGSPKEEISPHKSRSSYAEDMESTAHCDSKKEENEIDLEHFCTFDLVLDLWEHHTQVYRDMQSNWTTPKQTPNHSSPESSSSPSTSVNSTNSNSRQQIPAAGRTMDIYSPAGSSSRRHSPPAHLRHCPPRSGANSSRKRSRGATANGRPSAGGGRVHTPRSLHPSLYSDSSGGGGRGGGIHLSHMSSLSLPDSQILLANETSHASLYTSTTSATQSFTQNAYSSQMPQTVTATTASNYALTRHPFSHAAPTPNALQHSLPADSGGIRAALPHPAAAGNRYYFSLSQQSQFEHAHSRAAVLYREQQRLQRQRDREKAKAMQQHARKLSAAAAQQQHQRQSSSTRRGPHPNTILVVPPPSTGTAGGVMNTSAAPAVGHIEPQGAVGSVYHALR